MIKANNVDEYIVNFSVPIREKLELLRSIIRGAAPDAEELISYGMPAYKLHGPLVYFAAYEKHIGFYPTPSAIVKFENELAGYRQAKGTVQLPVDKPLPRLLLARIVKFRVKENMEKAKASKRTKK